MRKPTPPKAARVITHRVRHARNTPAHERETEAWADNRGGAKTKTLRLDHSPPERLALKRFSWEQEA